MIIVDDYIESSSVIIKAMLMGDQKSLIVILNDDHQANDCDHHSFDHQLKDDFVEVELRWKVEESPSTMIMITTRR